jgi:hypothetical protein
MAAPSVTYSFTNGTTADATQVNTNFTDLINGLSDGTKDLSFNALTVAGAATLNGNVTLGNASADSLTMNASLASSIAIGTNATYNIGGATTGLAGLYLGDNTRTVRLVAGVLTGTYTITLPAATALTGQTAIFSSASQMEFRYPEKFTAAKTTAYTATGDETIIPVDTTSAFSVTLPAAATMTGKKLTVIKTTSDFNVCTIDADGAETINGAATTKVSTQYEAVSFVSNGTAWFITDRRIPNTPTSYTPTLIGFGTPSNLTFTWARRGKYIYVEFAFTCGTSTATEARIPLPVGLTYVAGGVAINMAVGILCRHTGTSATDRGCFVLRENAANAYLALSDSNAIGSGAGETLAKAQGSAIMASGETAAGWFEVPITEWEA